LTIHPGPVRYLPDDGISMPAALLPVPTLAATRGHLAGRTQQRRVPRPFPNQTGYASQQETPMGGLFRVPKVATPTAVASAPEPSDANAAATAAANDRRRRGLASTVATSDRGVVGASLPVAPRKSLLGE
jgi:hypothetical protein